MLRQGIEWIGNRCIALLVYIGGVGILFMRIIGWLYAAEVKWRPFLSQMAKIGVESLPIVFLTSIFTGIVLSLQSAYQMQKIAAEMYIASLVSLSMVRELGPVLTALVVAGRVGASITAEIGTMKVTEQIDALKTLATDPIKFLVVPRFAAIIIMLPILTVYADMVGIFGGYLIGVYKLGINFDLYWRMTYDPLIYKDLFSGLIKAFFFGMIICIIGSHEGFRTEGGAEGVGKATTLAVVMSFILIIAADCLFTALFYFVF